MSDAADVIKDCITEFSRLQDWMIPIKEASPNTYDSMYKQYIELKVIGGKSYGTWQNKGIVAFVSGRWENAK